MKYATIKDWDELKGKTISDIRYSRTEDSNDLFLCFTDNTFIRLYPQIPEYYEEASVLIDYDFQLMRETNYNHFDIGAISKEEYESNCDKYQEEIRVQEEKEQLNIYQRLKKKFESI